MKIWAVQSFAGILLLPFSLLATPQEEEKEGVRGIWEISM